MRHRLIVLEDPLPPRELVPSAEVLEIGRDTERAIVLNHRTVSRRHAVIRRVEGALVLEDAGSTFGTFVNDEALSSSASATLRDGDVLRFGKVRVVCRFEEEPVDLRAASRDAAFGAQANARLLLLEGDYVHRRPIAGVTTLVGGGAHCTVRLHDAGVPAEQALIRVVDGSYRIESRSRANPPLLNEAQEPVVEPAPLPSNSAIIVHRAQLLFLYDFDCEARPIADPLAAVPRRVLLRHVARQCGIAPRALREIARDRRVLGQALGEILVQKGLVTPLFWRVVCARLLEERPRARFAFWRRGKDQP